MTPLRLVTSTPSLERLKARDGATLIWERFGARITRLVRATLGPDAASDDLVQDAFVAILTGLARVRDEERLEAYVVGVTLNTVRVELRRRRRRRFFAPLLGRADVTADDPSISAEVSELFRRLDRLSDDQRLAFSLRHLEQLELTEVAAAMNVSLATAKRRLAEARENLEGDGGSP
jgi:RNA polymerase sigma-70 factor (ECF subfamily)